MEHKINKARKQRFADSELIIVSSGKCTVA